MNLDPSTLVTIGISRTNPLCQNWVVGAPNKTNKHIMVETIILGSFGIVITYINSRSRFCGQMGNI